ncbi:hypothetical protein MG293_020535 [Ovis ammon polii]|uniref:Uncharacterized protein n=1 Tax=Ovis ammon polii TaxID=230172 RepID=A0AAD4Y085_OVIAM|nr:hypothetical protein MG293_020535 [Ovis ammon polii]KAI4550154.1 hypothetical protein MJT46_018880 [Ovis ammon polii x Ovis aries]
MNGIQDGSITSTLSFQKRKLAFGEEQHDGGCEVQIVSRDPGLAARLPCHSSISAVAWDWAGTCRKFEKEGIEPRLCRCSRETSLLSPGHLALDHKLAGLRQSVQDEPLNDRLSGTSKPGTGEALGKEGSTALSGAFSSAGKMSPGQRKQDIASHHSLPPHLYNEDSGQLKPMPRNSDRERQESSDPPGSASRKGYAFSLHLSLNNRGHLGLSWGPDRMEADLPSPPAFPQTTVGSELPSTDLGRSDTDLPTAYRGNWKAPCKL